MKWMKSIYDVILDRDAEELLGAIGLAVALAIAVSGVFALLRKRVEDKVLLVIVLLLLVSLSSMGMGAGYVAMLKDRRAPTPFRGDLPPGLGMGMGMRRTGMMPRTLRRADTDGDGRISQAEAADAAAAFLSGLDPEKAGSVDLATLTEALWQSSEGMPPERPDPMVDLDSRVGWAVSILADADHNGRVELDELRGFFAGSDRDGDHELNAGEMRHAFRHLIPAMDGRNHPRERHAPGRFGADAPAPPEPAPNPGPSPTTTSFEAMPGSGPQAAVDR